MFHLAPGFIFESVRGLQPPLPPLPCHKIQHHVCKQTVNVLYINRDRSCHVEYPHVSLEGELSEFGYSILIPPMWALVFVFFLLIPKRENIRLKYQPQTNPLFQWIAFLATYIHNHSKNPVLKTHSTFDKSRIPWRIYFCNKTNAIKYSTEVK